MLTTHYYYIEPSHWRSALYALVGFALLAVLALYLPDGLAAAAPLAALSACMVLPLRWRLRVDEEGIARSGWLAWDLWPWEVFATGRIAKRSGKHWGFRIFDPARPFGKRSLWLDLLSPLDRTELLRLIHAYYELPPAPPIASALTIHFGVLDSATFDEAGIHLKGAKSPVPWADVRRLRIVRHDRLRHDFHAFSLSLPDRELAWTTADNEWPARQWHGARSEDLNSLLLAHIPASRIVVDVRGERPTCRADIEARLAHLRSTRGQLKVVLWTLGAIVLGLLIWMAAESLLKAAICAAGLAVQSPIFWLVQRLLEQQERQARKWLEVHDQEHETRELPSSSQ